MYFKHKIIINAPLKAVYNELHNIKKWPEIIPHVKKIEVIEYDDEKQHLLMSVYSKKKIEEMETIRHFKYCDYIDFHQISMPKPIKRHDGIWKFYDYKNKTMVESIHEIETSIPIIGNLSALIAWKGFVKKNSDLTLRAVKLKLEYRNNKSTRIINKSCFIKHSIDVEIPIKQAFNVIGNPKMWPKFYPTAINVDVLQDTGDLCEYRLIEYVGKKEFHSHIYQHMDYENNLLYYQHYPPTFPLKYMVIRWVFEKSDDRHTRFIILREYDINIPIIGKILAYTVAKKIIEKHVDDYHRDLKNYERYCKMRGKYEVKCESIT